MERTSNVVASAPGRVRAFFRRFFRVFNRCFMVPVFRLGLGTFIGSPLTGYIMVLKTIGAKTGKVRYTPLNYAILDDQVYCIAGWGQISHWYRNLRVHPGVACILPGVTLVGVAEEVTDSDAALRAFRQVLRNAGLVGFAAGLNPFAAPDEVLRQKLKDVVIISVRPTGIGGGPADPGGWFWLVSWALHGVAVRAIVRWRRRRGA